MRLKSRFRRAQRRLRWGVERGRLARRGGACSAGGSPASGGAKRQMVRRS
jgi:hypothetical protein